MSLLNQPRSRLLSLACRRIPKSHRHPLYSLRLLSSSVISDSHEPASKSRSPIIEKGLEFPGLTKTTFTPDLVFLNPSQTTPIPIYRLIDTNGRQYDKSYTPDIDQETATKMYTNMLTMAVMDQIMYEAQRQGRISFYMVNAGEEASSIGSISAMKPNDVVFSQYREAAALLHRGLTVKQMMDQLYGNKEDSGMGRAMPVHYLSRELNIHPISSPLGTQLLHAVGAAYALKLRGEKGGSSSASSAGPEGSPAVDDGACAIVYFGDGASSEGDFHAALNMASTLGAPTIFFCRNNGYAISTPTHEQYRGDGIASRGPGYGMLTIRVDGNDLLAVRRVTQQARELATKYKQPVLIEAMSYRISHHSTSDDSFAYRSKREVEDWKRKDNPIVRFRKFMENKEWWSDEKEVEAKARIKKQVLKEFSKAEKEKKAKISNIFEDTLDVLSERLEEQRRELGEVLDAFPTHFDLSMFEGGRSGLGDK